MSSTTTFLVPGSKEINTEFVSLRKYFPDASVESYSIGVSRSTEATKEKVMVEKGNVVALEFENNIKWFYDHSEFTEKIKAQQDPGRGTGEDGRLEIPLQWQEDNAQSRGFVTGALKLLGIHVFKNVAGKKIARSIAQHIEQNIPNVLYNCDDNFVFKGKFDPNTAKDGTLKYLLLLHGTASSTEGSFGGLIKQQGGDVYKALFKEYGGKIIAYEHKTFTQTPVQNVIELLEQVPNNITLDILSHSRGGLVGEVLARISDPRFKGVFTKKEMDLLEKSADAGKLIEEIKLLQKAAAEKQIKVNRFVRVACPAAGTTLVSNRMDTFLNILFNILSNLPGEVVSTISEGLEALVMAVVEGKNDVNTLPGIECMKPDSWFIKAINFPETKINSDLVVIAGDALGEGFLNRVKMFLVDSFYKEDNDLVVNTSSMKKGTGRESPFSIYDEQRGDVNHFHYFINATSQNIIHEALIGKVNESRGFYRSTLLKTEESKEPVTESNRSGKTIDNQSILYILPGLMGSHLEVDNERVWLNYHRIALGELERIHLNGTDNVKASGINSIAYKDLVNYFSNYYYVVPFAYDWRKSIRDAADELKKHVEETMTKTNKSISFIAHSVGGLVFQAFATKYKDLWKQLQQREQCRVLLLGTPHAGSYTISRILLGIDKTINALSALDLANNKKILLDQFNRYPGLLELLPSKAVDDFSNKVFWDKIGAETDPVYPIPQLTDPDSFKLLQKAPFTLFEFDPKFIKYIAGQDDQTPNRMEFDEENKRIRFFATPFGDGTVTWESIPTALRSATYYVPAEHGRLAAHAAAFPAFKELLEGGSTQKLPQSPPVSRGESKTERMPDMELVTTPDEDELWWTMMGMKKRKSKALVQPLKVSITHGDMGHALYPVITGHFEGDSIVEAEKVLDLKMNKHFSIRYDAANYPEKIGTHELLINKDTKPPGGIVVGLGPFGELTENDLAKTLKQALLTYIIKAEEDGSKQEDAPIAESKQGLGISYLLIGSGFGGLSIYSSIKAIISAVRDANTFFTTRERQKYALITHIEIIELYQQKVIQAGRIIQKLLENNILFSNIAFEPDTIKKVSGRRNEIPDETENNWWHRLKIYETEKLHEDNSKTRVIKFSSITDKARNEEEVLATNVNIVDKLIKQAAASSNRNENLCKTLYEMLVPHHFKGYGADLRNIVLIVDKETARYPWEMLYDAYSGNDAPIVTKAGFLRQLSTGNYRVNSQLSIHYNALVIGNPLLNDYYPKLPGAALEARQVAEQLRQAGYDVTPHIEEPGENIIMSLHPRRYKIIHIAAHGVVNDKKTRLTGVVLGEELILTPSDFKQIRNIPELVFINCCSLGEINKSDEERLQRKYEVAAGIGTQLIEMGVKAVIVAGWEVDDAAALTFSDTFYRELLSGNPFGESVRIARETTYKNHSNSNTWGAYQCYGDPYYTLRPISERRNGKTYKFCDTVEAINKLQSLISSIEAATSREEKEVIGREMNRIMQGIELHLQWKDEASLLELLAELHKELGLRDKAIEYYERLFALEDANFSVKSIEQYCNIKVKEALKQYSQGKITLDEANIAIDECINQLSSINKSLTSERSSLIASAYKRKAEINIKNKKSFLDNIILSADHYYQAYKLFVKNKGKVYYYPLYNWLITAAIIRNIATQAQKKNDAIQAFEILYNDGNGLLDIMLRAEQYVTEIEETKPDFWNKTALSMQYLLQLITTENVKEITTYKNAIIKNHQMAWSVEGSVNKMNAVKEHTDFVYKIVKNNKDKFTDDKLIEERIKIIRELSDFALS